MKKVVTFLIIMMIIMGIIIYLQSARSPERVSENNDALKTKEFVKHETQANQNTATKKASSDSSSRKEEFQIVIPPEVKERWSAVTFVIKDKTENKKQELSVKIGNTLKLPDSNLSLKVGSFLPDFNMKDNIITSSSTELINPAVALTVFEEGKQIFPTSGQWGWLYEKFPDLGSFKHDRYDIYLKEGLISLDETIKKSKIKKKSSLKSRFDNDLHNNLSKSECIRSWKYNKSVFKLNLNTTSCKENESSAALLTIRYIFETNNQSFPEKITIYNSIGEEMGSYPFESIPSIAK